MEGQNRFTEAIAEEILRGLGNCTSEQIKDILDHVSAPDSWERKSVSEALRSRLNETQAERDALYEDLRGTCAVCDDPSIFYDPIMGCCGCQHLDRRRIVGFGRRTDEKPVRCPNWKWRGIQPQAGSPPEK